MDLQGVKKDIRKKLVKMVRNSDKLSAMITPSSSENPTDEKNINLSLEKGEFFYYNIKTGEVHGIIKKDNNKYCILIKKYPIKN